MIGKLTGRVDAVSLNAVIVDVGGVGYEVTVGTRTLTSLPPVGETVSLAIDTHVREDEIRLYGFASEHERAWFRALQTVQGVGAKVALSVLGTLSAADLANAVALQDKGQVSPRAGRRSQGGGPHRHRAEGQDADARACHPGPAEGWRPSPSCRRGSPRAMRYRRWPISAMPMARRRPLFRRRSARWAARRAPRS